MTAAGTSGSCVLVAVVLIIRISRLTRVLSVCLLVMLGIYERFGRYVKTMGSGLQYFNPFTDRIHVLDMKTNIINLSKQKALTKDNIEVDIDAAVYYHIKIPRKTFYAVENIDRSVRELTFATLRSICGQYILQDLLEKRDEVTLELGKFVARQVHEWALRSRIFWSRILCWIRSCRIFSRLWPRKKGLLVNYD